MILTIGELVFLSFFFFNDTATTEIYTLSLHDALPIWGQMPAWRERYPGVADLRVAVMGCVVNGPGESKHADIGRSEEHTSELQSRLHLVCRLLLEKKKKTKKSNDAE